MCWNPMQIYDVSIDVPFQNIAILFNGIGLMVNCVVSQTVAEFVF